MLQEELDQIWGNWKIDKLLGEGSFGKVYRIEKKGSKEYEAALKVIRIPQNEAEIISTINDGMNEEGAKRYFGSIVDDIKREFDLMYKLKGNTNIVSYEDHEVIPVPDKIGWNIYIRMELLTPLFDYLKEKPLSIRDVIRLGIDICNALEVCQTYNIIHRDIKPENIFVSKIGNFKLGDFGIARQLEKTSSGLSKKGTYSYMAPEVYKGEEYNSTVDIYSLGIVLYRFLNNNRTPFLPAYPEPIYYSDKEKANSMRISGMPVPKPCMAEGRLAEIVLKACSYNPKERYETASEMKRDLESLLDEEATVGVAYPKDDKIVNQNLDYTSTIKDEEVSVTISQEVTHAAFPESEVYQKRKQEILDKNINELKKAENNSNKKRILIVSLVILIAVVAIFMVIGGRKDSPSKEDNEISSLNEVSYLNEMECIDKNGKLWTRSADELPYETHSREDLPDCSRNMEIDGHIVENVMDIHGNTYKYGLHVDLKGINEYYVSYDLNGEYSSFSGTYACPKNVLYEKSLEFSKYFEIYGDGEILFRSVETDCSMEPIDFSVNVEGVGVLMIKYPATDGPNEIATIFDAKLE